MSCVKSAFDDAYRHLDSNPPDTKAAVRSIFESIEILVKQMVTTKNLNKWVVENTLKEKCLSLFTDDVSIQVVTGLFDSMSRWVDSIHYYRHGQPALEPVAPSEEIAIHIISTGSSYLRLLIQLDLRLSNV